ncbi:unnamed protein product [Phytomonas sp. Hart1]|nr:unnamed protein product [Phytomonas sp. Hart1]|eukprot:CCW66918.1 unnamed protein product [Phytomonas sp. isolate Hart1]
MINKSESANQKVSITSLDHDAFYLKEMEQDPNIRLNLYRTVCNAALSEASTRGPSAISPLWIDVLLNGVEDCMSSTRRECVECIQKLIRAPTPGDVSLRRHQNPAYQSNLSALANHDAYENQPKKGALPVKNTDSTKRERPAKGRDTVVLCDDWRRQLANQLLHRWVRTRSGSAGWYQREGLLRVFKIYCDFNYTLYQKNLVGHLWLREVLFRVGIPSLHEDQLPVREEAASLLCIITQREGAARSYVFDRVVHKLQDLLTMQKKLSTLPKDREAQTHVIEGYLIALIKLFEQNPGSGRKENMYQLLMGYASYPASSVRQYVAETLCPPSEVLCIRLLKELSMGCWWSSSHVQNHWREGETVLMALQRHIIYYLTQGKGCNFNLERLISVAIGESTTCFLYSCIESLLDASCDSRFELSRMGQQIIPLLLQIWVRFSRTAEAIFKVVQELTTSSTHTTRRSGTPFEHPSVVQRDRNRILAEVIVPLIWWYLAVRRATAVMDDQKNRKKLEEVHVDQFFRTLQDITSKIKDPMYSSVALIIGCYFLPLLNEKNVTIIQETLLNSKTWEYILRTPPAMSYLHFGLDFVSSMKYRGRDLQHLIPVWLDALEMAQTHQQYILVTMIREALCFTDAERLHGSEKPSDSILCRPFRFAYHNTFAAPAMLDGGEEISLGYTWLKMYFPTEQEIPSGEMFFGTAAGPRAGSNDLEGEKAVVEALRHYICNGLYLSPVIEPEILREVRALMVAIVKAYPSKECSEFVLESILMRLDRVCPEWENKEKITMDLKQKASDWDTWDDDNASGGPVEGVSIEEEIQEASHSAIIIIQKMSHDTQESISKKFADRLVKLLH